MTIKMRITLMVAVMGLIAISATAQLRIGPDNSVAVTSGAMLEVVSPATSPMGFLPPRIALADVSVWGLAGTATAGMIIYNTSTGTIGGTGTGLYIYGTKWVRMVDVQTLALLPRAVMSQTINQGGTAAFGGFLQNRNYAVKYNLVDTNTGVNISTDGATFIIVTPGLYIITTSLRVNEKSGGNTSTPIGERYLAIGKNITYDPTSYLTSSAIAASSMGLGASSGINCLSATAILSLVAGDTISTIFFQGSAYDGVMTDVSVGTNKMGISMIGK